MGGKACGLRPLLILGFLEGNPYQQLYIYKYLRYLALNQCNPIKLIIYSTQLHPLLLLPRHSHHLPSLSHCKNPQKNKKKNKNNSFSLPVPLPLSFPALYQQQLLTLTQLFVTCEKDCECECGCECDWLCVWLLGRQLQLCTANPFPWGWLYWIDGQRLSRLFWGWGYFGARLSIACWFYYRFLRSFYRFDRMFWLFWFKRCRKDSSRCDSRLESKFYNLSSPALQISLFLYPPKVLLGLNPPSTPSTSSFFPKTCSLSPLPFPVPPPAPQTGNESTKCCSQRLFALSARRRAENLFHSARDPQSFFIWGARFFSTKVLNIWASFFYPACILIIWMFNIIIGLNWHLCT